jgi:hypothetical protein
LEKTKKEIAQIVEKEKEYIYIYEYIVYIIYTRTFEVNPSLKKVLSRAVARINKKSSGGNPKIQMLLGYEGTPFGENPKLNNSTIDRMHLKIIFMWQCKILCTGITFVLMFVHE